LSKRVSVGRVGKPHGLKGGFVVEEASDDPARFAVGGCGAVVGYAGDVRGPACDPPPAAAEIRASGWPDAEMFVAENLLAAPSRAEAIAHFESLV
jgi:hypothetical protein